MPGELIVKLEHGMIDWQGFEETPIAEVPILNSQFSITLRQYDVRSVERVFKGIFARPPLRLVNWRGLTVHNLYL